MILARRRHMDTKYLPAPSKWTGIANGIRAWLQTLGLGNGTLGEHEWPLECMTGHPSADGSPAALPTQHDGDSCGVFMCGICEALLCGIQVCDLAHAFSNDDIPAMRTRMYASQCNVRRPCLFTAAGAGMKKSS